MANDSLVWIDEFWQEPVKINTARVNKKRSRDGFLSNHRRNKTYAHTTIGGLGHVGRVYHRRSNGK